MFVYLRNRRHTEILNPEGCLLGLIDPENVSFCNCCHYFFSDNFQSFQCRICNKCHRLNKEAIIICFIDGKVKTLHSLGMQAFSQVKIQMIYSICLGMSSITSQFLRLIRIVFRFLKENSILMDTFFIFKRQFLQHSKVRMFFFKTVSTVQA